LLARSAALYFGIRRCHQEVAMMKSVVAGTVALTLAGAGLALAQSAAPQRTEGQTQTQEQTRSMPSAEDLSAFTDARIAALKAGLKLNADQEKNWPPVEAALRDLAKQRADRMRERADRRAERREARASGNAASRPDTIELLRRGADALNTRAASLKRLADASEPLYKSLDDSQKRRFGALLRMGGGEGMRGRMMRRGG
jgi:zinc resistance-associated protein